MSDLEHIAIERLRTASEMSLHHSWGEKITHWTPVLLPLPEPPKEG